IGGSIGSLILRCLQPSATVLSAFHVFLRGVIADESPRVEVRRKRSTQPLSRSAAMFPADALLQRRRITPEEEGVSFPAANSKLQQLFLEI
ncbi:hypothetical protein JZ751_024004, partial [Albula glossodonta]